MKLAFYIYSPSCVVQRRVPTTIGEGPMHVSFPRPCARVIIFTSLRSEVHEGTCHSIACRGCTPQHTVHAAAHRVHATAHSARRSTQCTPQHTVHAAAHRVHAAAHIVHVIAHRAHATARRVHAQHTPCTSQHTECSSQLTPCTPRHTECKPGYSIRQIRSKIYA